METHPTPLHHNQQPFLSKKLLDESKHSNSFACIRGSAMDSFIYTCYYLLPPFLKQTSVMTKCLLLMQPAGGSIAARKSHPPFPFICPSPTPLSLPSLSLMVYHFLCIFPASYSPNPPNPSYSFVCICINVCNVRAYQADIVVQQWQGEEGFQSQFIEAWLRQTCQKKTHRRTNKSSNPICFTCEAPLWEPNLKVPLE